MSDSASPVRTHTHWPLLLLALTILVVTTVWPHSLSNEAGQADHLLAMLVFWAMCASFIRGVGFIPHHRLWRVLFSIPAVGVALLAAIVRGGGVLN